MRNTIGHPHPITIQDLIKKGVVIPGRKYVPAEYVPKKAISLAKCRSILAKIKGSLTQTASEIRDED